MLTSLSSFFWHQETSGQPNYFGSTYFLMPPYYDAFKDSHFFSLVPDSVEFIFQRVPAVGCFHIIHMAFVEPPLIWISIGRCEFNIFISCLLTDQGYVSQRGKILLEQMKMLLVIISHAENIKLHCPFEIQQKNFLHKNKSVDHNDEKVLNRNILGMRQIKSWPPQ